MDMSVEGALCHDPHRHRGLSPKRSARKRKPGALKGSAIVRASKRREPDPEPANDDAPAKPVPPAAKSAIVTTTSRKRARLERGEKRRAAEPDDDPEATARVRAFLDRMIRPR
jgi:hypothetical protein